MTAEEPEQSDIAQELSQLMDTLAPIKETVQGHRNWALSVGFGEDAADDMAADLHAHLLDGVFAE